MSESMKKYVKAITVGLLAGSLTLGAVGCNQEKENNVTYYDNENDPLRFTTFVVVTLVSIAYCLEQLS